MNTWVPRGVDGKCSSDACAVTSLCHVVSVADCLSVLPLPVRSHDGGHDVSDLFCLETHDGIELLCSEIPFPGISWGLAFHCTHRARVSTASGNHQKEHWSNLENTICIQHTGQRKGFHHLCDWGAISKIKFNGHFFLWISQHTLFMRNWGSEHILNC